MDAQTFKNWRIKKLSQKQAANFFFVRQSAISRYESGVLPIPKKIIFLMKSLDTNKKNFLKIWDEIQAEE